MGKTIANWIAILFIENRLLWLLSRRSHLLRTIVGREERAAGRMSCFPANKRSQIDYLSIDSPFFALSLSRSAVRHKCAARVSEASLIWSRNRLIEMPQRLFLFLDEQRLMQRNKEKHNSHRIVIFACFFFEKRTKSTSRAFSGTSKCNVIINSSRNRSDFYRKVQFHK